MLRWRRPYQGTSDNTAAVSVLLAAARDLVAQQPDRAVALLFTAAEKRGLKGAHAFQTWAQERKLALAEVSNLDMLGRGRLAICPSALPGFYFCCHCSASWSIIVVGSGMGNAMHSLDPGLVRRLTTLMRTDIVIEQRFTAYSDSNVFREGGIPMVTISSDNMYELDLVWERDRDRVEWLDERNLTQARQLVVKYALS
jgi:Zn-dependent M28 family amino/carboxypeptidase